MPAYGAHRTLPYVLAGLSAQTYPSHLVELIVVDDGAHCRAGAARAAGGAPDNARIVQVEQGWGRANACALGAGLADGDVIHWLDADMLPGREHVEAQLRWHHEIDYAVVLGNKWFVDPAPLDGVRPAEVRDAVAADRMAEYFPADVLEPHEWVERYYSRFDDLRTIGPRACRIHVGATASLARDLYRESGGMDTSLKLGEDISLGYRLGEAGAVFLPDREARSWHLGRTHVMTRRAEVNDYNDCFLSDRLPELRNKRRAGRLYAVPYLEVVLDTTGLLHGSVVATVDSVLESTLPDLQVTLIGPWSDLDDTRIHPLEDPMLDTRLVQASYAGDPRVRLVESLPEGRCPAMFRMTLENADWAPTRKTAGPAGPPPRAHPPRAPGRADARRHDRSHRADRRRLAVPARHQVRRVPRRRARRAVRRLDLRRGRGRLLAVPRGAPPAHAGHRRRGRGPGQPPGTSPTCRPHPASRPSRRPRPAPPARPPDHRRPRPTGHWSAPCGTGWRPCWGAGDGHVRATPAGRRSRPRRSAQAPRGVRGRLRPQRHQHHVRRAADPGHARPQPEVLADETNPKGSASRSGSSTSTPSCSSAATSRSPTPARRPGSRPASSPTSSGCATGLHTWLEEQFARSATRAGREGPAAGVVPRPVAVGGAPLRRRAGVRHHAAARDRGGRQQAAILLHPLRRDRPHGGWVNMMLHTERATRGSQRAYVRYEDLLTDWTIPLFGIGQRFDLFAVKSASANDIRKVHQFIDPEPPPRPAHLGRRRGARPGLRDIAEESWAALDKLADDGGDRPDVHATLDEMRAAYASFYEEAEAIASSTALASRREGYADGAAGGRRWEPGRRPDPARPAAWCRLPPRAQGHRPERCGRAESAASRGTPTTTSAGPGTTGR
jgi:glycosyltransferase involved in cell wall biosynthesis